MGIIIDGKAVSKGLKAEIKKAIDDGKALMNREPCLAAVLVGDDGGSIYYINNQEKICKELGLKYKKYFLNKTVGEEKVIEVIEELNNDDDVDGIILFLPLPGHMDEKKVTSKLNPLKDVDGLTDVNLGKFYKGEHCFIPCTPQSVVSLIKSTGIVIKGKHAVIIGRSNIVGKPAAMLLLNENATITICHSKTANLKEICKEGDILVCALGKPEFITEEYVKEGAVVVDVGTTRVEGVVKGDVAFDKVINKAGFVTPVPGGVGAMTTAMLIKNTCEAWIRNVY